MAITKDALQKLAYRAFYDTYLQELCANELLSLWNRVNVVITALVAATATGSAIAGWTLWSTAGGKVLWIVISGIAALAALLSQVFAVPQRINENSDLLGTFQRLRLQLQTFYEGLSYETDLTKAEKRLNELAKEYEEKRVKARPDLVMTRKWLIKIQRRLNDIMIEGGYAEDDPKRHLRSATS